MGNLNITARIYIARRRLSVKETESEERLTHVPEFISDFLRKNT
jgi:hypothetical protein